MSNFTQFFSTFTGNSRKSLGTTAFIASSMLVIVIVILVCPTATWAILAIMGAAPAFLNALAAFIVALRQHPTTATTTSKPQEPE